MRTDAGIDVLGQLPWGSHVCHFYRTGSDLAETLVPYFRSGLEHGEKCVWVTSEPFPADAAWRALGEVVPDLERRRARGQIEIVEHGEWYLKSGATDAEGTLAAWVEREQTALAQGWKGLRLTGNTYWLERSGWADFMDYEARVTGTFASRRIVGLCSYSLDRCGGDEVLDVVRHHSCALARRGGVWEIVESAALRTAKTELAAANERLEQRVAERTAQLEAALRARDEFLSVASHELKTPVAALQLLVGMITRAYEKAGAVPAAEALPKLARAEAQCARLSTLVNDLLDVSRARTGALELTRTSFDLAAVARELLERVGPSLAFSRCALELHAPAPVHGRWDRTRLEQVLTNLLANAARHAPGSPVRVAVEAVPGGARLVVRDGGPGIAAGDRGRVFEAFSQLDRGRGRGGFGVGLWVVKQIVEAHGGTVEVEDAPGGGAAFSILLPADAPATA